MLARLLKRLWIELLVGLDPMYTFEGFEVTKKPFVMPPNSSELEPRLKRRLTFFNLFVNQHQPIDTIACVLDTRKGRVVSALIEEGFIKERRRHKSRWVKRERRRPSPALVSTYQSPGSSVTNPPGFIPTKVSSPRIQTLFGAERAKPAAAKKSGNILSRLSFK